MWSGRIPSNLGRDGTIPYIYLPTTEATDTGQESTHTGNILSNILNSGRAACNSDLFTRIRCPDRCKFWESLTTGQLRLLIILAISLVILTVILATTLAVLEEQDNELTDLRLEKFTEELLYLDRYHNLFGQLNITTDGPKLIHGKLHILDSPTIAHLIDLQYEYHPDVDVPEVFTDEYYDKQQRFINAIINTKVMKTTEKLFLETGLITTPILDTIEDIWFGLYSRSSQDVKGSSGFEHVFAGEIKNKEVIGLHNWVYFLDEQDNPESHPNLTYNGYQGMLELGNNGVIINIDFKWLNMNKSSSMFIGTSPELEMAVYTICFLARPNSECPVSMAGKKFSVYTYAYNGTMLLGTAYPHIKGRV